MSGSADVGRHPRTSSWEQVRDEALAAMSDAQRAEYDAAAIEAEARLQLAELVYHARTAAGLSQTEFARRAGTRQAVMRSAPRRPTSPGQSSPTC